MNWFAEVVRRVRVLFQRDRFDQDLADEMRLHVDLLARDRAAVGLSETEAQAEAQRAFGNLTHLKEVSRGVWRPPRLEEVGQDVRYAMRALRRNPLFAAMAIISLALGLGANLAIFSAVYSVLLKPLPYHDSDRLVWLWEQNPSRHWTENPVSGATIHAWSERNHVFTDLAAFEPTGATLTGAAEPVGITGQQVTPNLFRLLGVRPALGHDFVDQDGQPGGPVNVIISWRLWQRQLGGDSGVIGRHIAYSARDDAGGTVVGVMPESFSDRYAGSMAAGIDLWIATALDINSGDNGKYVLGRLRPNASLATAEREMDAISVQMEQERPSNTGWRVSVVALHDQVAGSARTTLAVLFGAALFVVLIACANVANLLLARGAAREREMTVRAVLGASRGRLVRQLLAEGAVLGGAGGALGIGLAVAGGRALAAMAPAGAAAPADRTLLATMAGYTALSILATIALFALLPAFSMSESAAKARLDSGGRGATHGARTIRFRSALIVLEFALAVVLVAGAGLMLRTLRAVGGIPVGVNAEGVMTLSMPFRGERYRPAEAHIAFWRQLLPRIAAIPGVTSASVTRGLPMQGWGGTLFVAPDQPEPLPGHVPSANYVAVSEDYFKTMGIPIRRGRAFTATDDATQPHVAIVNEALAKQIWPDQDPMGRTIAARMNDSLPRIVIGVAANVHSQGVEVPSRPEFYVPYQQISSNGYRPRQLVIRTSGNAGAVITAVRREVTAVDRLQSVQDVRPLTDVIDRPQTQRRFLSMLLSAFGVLALTLAAVGIYGVVAYSVAQRTREFGVRLALGAKPADVLRLVLMRGLVLAVGGIAVGIFGALTLTRFLSTMLYGVRATDAPTFLAVASGLAVVAVAAACIPARRAARVDPAVALRAE
jgi:putative ABC transport system permease protein